MRLRQRDLQTAYLKRRITIRDEEGNKETAYSDVPIELKMTVQSAGGVVSAQIYGERLPYIKSCKYQGDEIKAGKNEKDGICLYVSDEEEPDYEIKAIQPFSEHLNITLEKLVQ